MPKKSKKSGKKKTEAIDGTGHSASSLGIEHSAATAGNEHSGALPGSGHSIAIKPKIKVGEVRIEYHADGSIRLNLLP